MGDDLKRKLGRYWVLFYQPLPEAGERIAIALVFDDRRGPATVEYDTTFAKLLKVFPEVDPKVLIFYLESLRVELRTSVDIESTINSYGSQIAVSAVRRISLPVSTSAI